MVLVLRGDVLQVDLHTHREDLAMVDPEVYRFNSAKGSHLDERRGIANLYQFSSLPSEVPNVAERVGALDGNMRDGSGPLIH